MNRSENLQTLDQTSQWDVLIIGGGATGLGIAVDAAARGYKTLLIEKIDFAKGTSSRSTKLVHGGVRYLQNGDVSLVIEALKERGIMRSNAPHLVRDLSFIIPSYDWWASPFYGIGLKIYDMMAGKLGLGPSTLLNREETLEAIPNVKREGLMGGVIYHDGQFDDARMAVSLAMTAEDHGATLLNYMSFEGFLKHGDLITGIRAKDQLSGQVHEIQSKVVLNATGVFSDEVMQADQPDLPASIRPSQGVHIVLEAEFLQKDHAIMVPHTTDGRVLFAVPWNGYVVVGTTDSPMNEALEEPVAMEEEIDFILANAGMYMTRKPTRDDIRSIFVGLRPLAAGSGGGSGSGASGDGASGEGKSSAGDGASGDGSQKQSTKEVSRHHKVLVSPSGLVSILGGKWTTYRKMAEDAVNTAASVGDLRETVCPTATLPIHGFDEASDWSNPLHVYGTDAKSIQALDPQGNGSLSSKFMISPNQVRWAVRHEMAMTLEDVLARRSRALFLDAQEALNIAPKVAQIMAEELGQDEAWTSSQVSAFEQVAASYVPKRETVV